MDTEFDFLTPEFFNLLFFQQKNIVIFPYVDMKHLHSLDIFTLGYETVDIDSAVLHNLEDVLNYELNNSYSQSTPFYFILNATSGHIEQLLDNKNIHCVINTSENVTSLANGKEYIFYNKKSKIFLNFDFGKVDLSLENEILQSCQDKHELIDEIFKIKNAASKIFSSVNSSSLTDLPKILSDFASEYWDKILKYTRSFYEIEIPEIPKSQKPPTQKNKKSLRDFSHEYSMIVKSNKKIGQEFIQALHEYRYRKVNPSNLEVGQLFYPGQLYTYLRNHHWKAGIPQEFIDEWVMMKNTGNHLTESDLLEFKSLFLGLKMKHSSINIKPEIEQESITPERKEVPKKNPINKENIINIPSVNDYCKFKTWVLEKITNLEKIINTVNKESF